jgi:hypothetical protein
MSVLEIPLSVFLVLFSSFLQHLLASLDVPYKEVFIRKLKLSSSIAVVLQTSQTTVAF